VALALNFLLLDLSIDIGNSRIKYGLFEQGSLEQEGTLGQGQDLLHQVQALSIRHVIIASVARSEVEWADRLAHSGKRLFLDHRTPLPIQNLYRSPQTLGMDRLAGAVGAGWLFSGQDCLVIDAGTCITYDFLDKEGRYHGGSISPGIEMKFKALHTFTGRLPLTKRTSETILTGQTTEEALQSGVLTGSMAEVQGFISYYEQKFPGLTIVLTGGDATFFETNLKGPIFVIPELVLIGLNRILDYNV
jgi:type III pantothenate kinase